MSWRLARCLASLRAEVDQRWPNRDHTSDGSIGDAAHQRRKSDHDPNAAGVVRAIDIDRDGIDPTWLAEHLRRLGEYGDQRLAKGGYVIFEGRIAGAGKGWAWRTYTGENAHRHHIHVSCTLDANHYDSQDGWAVLAYKEDDDMNPEQDARLKTVEQELAKLRRQVEGIFGTAVNMEHFMARVEPLIQKAAED